MMLGAGLVNEALVLFEKNELLDAAIVCYRCAGRVGLDGLSRHGGWEQSWDLGVLAFKLFT